MTATPPGSKRARGDWAEMTALRHMQNAGLSLLRRNYHCSCGEIDIVMEDGAAIVFVEVRYRRSNDYGTAAETVDARKQARVVGAAQHYLQRHPAIARRPCRFDVVVLRGEEPRPALQWIRDAFQA